MTLKILSDFGDFDLHVLEDTPSVHPVVSPGVDEYVNQDGGEDVVDGADVFGLSKQHTQNGFARFEHFPMGSEKRYEQNQSMKI